MLKRLGLSGAKRLRAALEPRLTHCTTMNADGLGSPTTGAVYARMCSSLTQNIDGPSSSGRQAQEPNSRWRYTKDRAAERQHSGISFLQQATGDYELHLRLAALWGMPSELLFERQQTVAKMLGPAGCGTAAHALWLLVRAPQLRHMPEAVLWASLKQLQRLVSHTEIDRAAMLTAVYKYPWMLEAMSEPDTPAATAAAAAQRSRQQPPSSAAAPAAASFSTTTTQGTAVEPASWAQELAAVILELQQADYLEHVQSGKASRGIRMSPGFAAAALRTYLAVAEVQQQVSNATSGFANRLLGITPEHSILPTPAAADAHDDDDDDCPASSTVLASSSSSSSSAQCSAVPAAPRKMSQPEAASASQLYPGSATGEVLAALQQQHQRQHLLMQQLLVACPHLTVLPPELLLARYERLTSVVSGCAEAASDLVVANPFLLVTYDDVATTHADAQAIRQVYA